jgi:hypothetical protein
MTIGSAENSKRAQEENIQNPDFVKEEFIIIFGANFIKFSANVI